MFAGRERSLADNVARRGACGCAVNHGGRICLVWAVCGTPETRGHEDSNEDWGVSSARYITFCGVLGQETGMVGLA